MPKINVISLNREFIINDNSVTVFENLQINLLDWMHACGAKGLCTTCRMIVTSGMQNLSSLSDREKYYKRDNRLQSNERLACQCQMSGDIEIKVPGPCRLPHIQYFD